MGKDKNGTCNYFLRLRGTYGVKLSSQPQALVHPTTLALRPHEDLFSRFTLLGSSFFLLGSRNQLIICLLGSSIILLGSTPDASHELVAVRTIYQLHVATCSHHARNARTKPQTAYRTQRVSVGRRNLTVITLITAAVRSV